MEIHTLHFDKDFSSRGEFLRFIYQNIYTLTAKHQSHFTEEGIDATLFHKSIIKNSDDRHTMPAIHCILDDGLKLTAYGSEAGRTLQRWFTLCEQSNLLPSKDFTSHRLSIPNIGTTSSKKTYYTSQNYIPYRSCYKLGLYFAENKTAKTIYDTEAGLQIMLKEHMNTFLKSIMYPNDQFSFLLTQYPDQYHWVEAIKPKPAYNGKKPAFQITIATDLILPDSWSIGQNTGTGNGLFKKIPKPDL